MNAFSILSNLLNKYLNLNSKIENKVDSNKNYPKCIIFTEDWQNYSPPPRDVRAQIADADVRALRGTYAKKRTLIKHPRVYISSTCELL